MPKSMARASQLESDLDGRATAGSLGGWGIEAWTSGFSATSEICSSTWGAGSSGSFFRGSAPNTDANKSQWSDRLESDMLVWSLLMRQVAAFRFILCTISEKNVE
jgi:hypothetical protein